MKTLQEKLSHELQQKSLESMQKGLSATETQQQLKQCQAQIDIINRILGYIPRSKITDRFRQESTGN